MEDSVTLANDHLELSFVQEDDCFTSYVLTIRHDEGRRRLGVGRFGRLVYRNTAGERREEPIRLTAATSEPRSIYLHGQWSDEDGISWAFEQWYTLDANPHQVVVGCRATPSGSRQLLHLSGPTFYAGEGAFGAAKTDALFPGLEYLLDDEVSSSTTFASESYAGRYVPHPYKITVPLMAISHTGVAVGLMWDPNQGYASAWRHPAAVFASPVHGELLGEEAESHLLGLFAPGVPRFVAENTLEAHRPLNVSPGNPVTLEARLVALADATSIDVLKVWVATCSLPALDPPQSYRENADLCVRSYLDVAWDAEARGWHHTLSDPWGPRYEPRVIAQLWRYGQWPAGNTQLRARAREQVRAGLAQALDTRQQEANASGHKISVPHLELALHYGLLGASLHALRGQAQAWMREQGPDGSWPWRSDVIQHGSFNTEERQRIMGQAGESSTGLTANRALVVLRWAQVTGDPSAEQATLRAVAWCNAQRRPEGAQTWELHLHVPDVLAVPYLIDINLAAYELTGDPSYVVAAERWAWTGLPFTYLWAAYYRPIMAYGTVPVFGVTFHDVQSWFGVDVHWNGLVYADALFRLAPHCSEGPWRGIALGLTACGMQQQRRDGPWLGMYPDAFSVVKGDEDYTWWLNPNLIGLNTFELAGLPLDVATAILSRDGKPSIRITSSAQVTDVQMRGEEVACLIHEPVAERSHTLVAGLSRPGRVTCEGEELPATESLDDVEAGWQWLGDFDLIAIKARHTSIGSVFLSIVPLGS